MSELKRVLVVGGGTAGHVIPAKPVIERLMRESISVMFVGTKSGLEKRLIDDLDVIFQSITTGKLRRYLSFENVVDMFRVLTGILQSILIVRRFNPDVVFSKGGYVAFPIVVAAWVCRVPVVAHESDLTPGLANRLCLPFVRTLCVNFTQTRVHAKKVVVTGTPLRASLLKGDAVEGRLLLEVPEGMPLVVVVGGSLGAESINRTIRDSLLKLRDGYFVAHVCGEGKTDSNFLDEPCYRQFEYIDSEWGNVLAAADVVVSRAGANSLYELLALRKPHVLIPLSRKASRGDQIENADMSALQGWSLVIQDDELNSDRMVGAIEQLWGERHEWQRKLSSFDVIDSVGAIYGQLVDTIRA